MSQIRTDCFTSGINLRNRGRGGPSDREMAEVSEQATTNTAATDGQTRGKDEEKEKIPEKESRHLGDFINARKFEILESREKSKFI